MNITAVKAEKRIKDVCDRLNISPAGRLWLDTCIDPFKDTEQKPIGYPDKQMARSCVQTYHAQIDIVKPVGLPAGAKWDCNIFLDPLWRSTPIYTTSSDGNNYQATGQVLAGIVGGLVVRSAQTGTPLLPATGVVGSSWPIDVFADDTDARIIGCGFEVHNTTEILEQSGSVTTYRVSDDVEQTVANVMASFTDVTTISTCVDAVFMPEPPTTSAEAVDLPMSKTWSAKDGVYVVPVINKESNNPLALTKLLVRRNEDGVVYTSQIVPASGVLRTVAITNAVLPFSLSGSFFTGLSETTVLTISLIANIEQFPSLVSPLHRLTNKNCPEDFRALELYSLIAREMPTGVPVDDNFLGSFIGAISRIASQVAPHVPKLIRGLRYGVEVISNVNDLMGGSNDKQNLSVLNVSNREKEKGVLNQIENQNVRNIQQIENLKRNLNNNNNMDQKEIIIRERPAQSNRNQGNLSGSVSRSNKFVKNKRDKNYNRVDRYYEKAMRRDNGGNRWMYQDRDNHRLPM